MKPPEYTPDEAALKAELDSLAQNIQPNADFVANLEAQLMQKEALASIQTRRKNTFIPIPYLLAIAAAFIIIPLCTFVIFQLIDNDNIDEAALNATPLGWQNFLIETQVAESQTAVSLEETQIPILTTPTPTQFSSTLMSPIRATATLIPPPPTVAVMPRTTATAAPSPTPSFDIHIWLNWLHEFLSQIHLFMHLDF